MCRCTQEPFGRSETLQRRAQEPFGRSKTFERRAQAPLGHSKALQRCMREPLAHSNSLHSVLGSHSDACKRCPGALRSHVCAPKQCAAVGCTETRVSSRKLEKAENTQRNSSEFENAQGSSKITRPLLAKNARLTPRERSKESMNAERALEGILPEICLGFDDRKRV